MKLIVFLSLVLCLSAVAQPNPINRRAMAIAGLAQGPNFNGLLPLGMKFRYKSADLIGPTVTNWVDEISSYSWTASGSGAPTRDTNAVIFDGVANRMIATNGTMADAASMILAVFQWISTSADQPILEGLAFSGGQVIFAIGDTPNFVTGGTYGNNAIGPIGTGLVDLICAQTASAPTYTTYTNGISGFTASSIICGGASLLNVGWNGADGFKGHFVLKEFIYWTNVGNMSSTIISNIHCYATNTYPHTP